MPEADPAPSDGSHEAEEPSTQAEMPLDDLVLAAAQAAMPANLLAQLQLAEGRLKGVRSAGRAGASQQSATRGRPTGVRRGEPRAGARLNVVETLRAAAPWQPLRHRETGDQTSRVQVRRDDFRVTGFRQRTRTTTIFVVDASGSSALNRLAEAKGAVELLLADCYVRRDRVALFAFRGKQAELLLPPTRSLVRAKRSLAGLPGGGGTPLAAALDAAMALADAIRRKDETPILVLLTDGRANVARDGTAGRPQAEQDALAAARLVHLAGFTALLVDTSARPQASARQLADAMHARYLPLPFADAAIPVTGGARPDTARRGRRVSEVRFVTRLRAQREAGAGNGRPIWDKDGADWPNRDASRFVRAAGLRLARAADGQRSGAPAGARHRRRHAFLARFGAAPGRAFQRDRTGPSRPRLHPDAAARRTVAAGNGPCARRPARDAEGSARRWPSVIRPAPRSLRACASTGRSPHGSWSA